MVRGALGKAMWLAKGAALFWGAALTLALVLGVTSMAFGANGGNFILGKLNNAATKVTGLTGNVNGAAMQVVNNNADANDTALSLNVQAGEPPLRVNSNTRVDNLNAATAQNADKLDALDSTDFVQGNGEVLAVSKAITPGNSASGTVVLDYPQSPNIQVRYHCPTTLSNNGTLLMNNFGSETLNVFLDGGGANPDFVQLSQNQLRMNDAAATGEHITIQAQGAGLGTIEVFSVHRTTDNVCHVQAQGLFSYQ